MLDTGSQTSNASSQIARISLRKSGEEGGGTIVDLDLSEEIASEEEAAKIDEVVPGALRLWRSSKNAQEAGEAETELAGAAAGAQAASRGGPFGQYAVPVGDDGVTFVFGQGSEIVDARNCEVLSFRVKSTPKVCMFVLKARLLGLGKSEIASLVGWLGATVPISSTRRQATLPFRRKSPGEIGEVVSGVSDGAEYAGVIVGRSSSDDGEMIEVDDCGRVFIVPAATISGSFPVGDGRDEQLSVFVKRCRKAKVTPSWLSLVTALGTAYLKNDAPNGQWRLTDEIVGAAFDSLRASA